MSTAGGVQGVRWSRIALPAEHGGWSLMAEPVLLGLLIAPTGAGALLGVAALAVFLARTPLKIAMGDLVRHVDHVRTRPATAFAVAYGLVALASVLGTARLTRTALWLIPLGAAAPFGAVQLWYDIRGRGRRIVPEIVGAIGAGATASSIVLAGGGGTATALAAWLVVAGRVISSVPVTRAIVRRGRRSGSFAVAGWAQGVALMVVAVGFVTGLLPLGAVAALCAVVVVSLAQWRHPPASVPLLGAQQVVVGLSVVLIAGLSLAPH